MYDPEGQIIVDIIIRPKIRPSWAEQDIAQMKMYMFKVNYVLFNVLTVTRLHEQCHRHIGTSLPVPPVM
jgi:hypothetical protein